MKPTEDQLDQINEAYNHRDDAIIVVFTGLAFAALLGCIAFACYVFGGA